VSGVIAKQSPGPSYRTLLYRLVDQQALASSAVTENTDVALGVFANMLE
jgi:hypothetical protein